MAQHSRGSHTGHAWASAHLRLGPVENEVDPEANALVRGGNLRLRWGDAQLRQHHGAHRESNRCAEGGTAFFSASPASRRTSMISPPMACSTGSEIRRLASCADIGGEHGQCRREPQELTPIPGARDRLQRQEYRDRNPQIRARRQRQARHAPREPGKGPDEKPLPPHDRRRGLRSCGVSASPGVHTPKVPGSARRGEIRLRHADT